MSGLASIGLQRGEVVVVPHDPAWTAAFAREAARLRPLLSDRSGQLEHVGSTAVPGLAAKPVIDLALGVDDLDAVSILIRPLEALGYTSFGERQLIGDHFFALGPEEQRTHYLHVVQFGGVRWHNYLGFRDRLRADPALRDGYARLKIALAARHARDRIAYTAGKDQFIRDALA